MIRFKIDQDSTDLLDRITGIYGFKRDSITSRIALAISVGKGKFFNHEHEIALSKNGREYSPTSNVFGRIINDSDNYIIYHTVLNQHYNKRLTETDFIKKYKLHLKHGLKLWEKKIDKVDLTKGEHILILIESIEQGLALRSKTVKTGPALKNETVKEYTEALAFDLGQTNEGEVVSIPINDLREFDNRNIAIAGMAGSGKTQLIKDILYQISSKTQHELKFIFFDYKGEGNPNQLQSFLNATDCEFVDIVNDGGIDFNPFLSINLDERQRPFSIKAFVDTIATFVPSVGIAQKNILTNVITSLFDSKSGEYPSVEELFESINTYYEENGRSPDTLYAGIQDLTTNIFNCSSSNKSILNKSMYLNLPPALSDTLRQLVVFLLLRYFNSFFSSTNDCEPKDFIFPLRYVIVIDEAHIYLKNKNARKALEELLRLLRSKGVIIIMLSQGVEDYKTKDFDFASQVKLPICLNVQAKDYKSISGFVGTPSSKYKLETEINNLDSGIGLINIGEPKSIKLRQWWRTSKDLGL